MSKFACPVPVATAIVDKKTSQLTDPWRLWMQRMGDDWVSENKVFDGKDGFGDVVPGYKYVVNGNTVTISYQGDTKTLKLPYPVLFPAVASTESAAIVVLQAGATAITAVGGTFSVTYIANMGGN